MAHVEPSRLTKDDSALYRALREAMLVDVPWAFEATEDDVDDVLADPDSAVFALEDDQDGLRALLLKLKSSTVHELRNRVVHQRAYRASREKAVAALESTREVLFGLAARLDLHDDLNWYLR